MRLIVTYIFQNISEFIFQNKIFCKITLQMVGKTKIFKRIKKIEKLFSGQSKVASEECKLFI